MYFFYHFFSFVIKKNKHYQFLDNAYSSNISHNLDYYFFSCTLLSLWEQKARATYEKLIDLCADDPDVVDPLRFLREREVVHFQRFGEALRNVQDRLAQRKFFTSGMNNTNSINNNTNNNNCGCGM